MLDRVASHKDPKFLSSYQLDFFSPSGFPTILFPNRELNMSGFQIFQWKTAVVPKLRVYHEAVIRDTQPEIAFIHFHFISSSYTLLGIAQ